MMPRPPYEARFRWPPRRLAYEIRIMLVHVDGTATMRIDANPVRLPATTPVQRPQEFCGHVSQVRPPANAFKKALASAL